MHNHITIQSFSEEGVQVVVAEDPRHRKTQEKRRQEQERESFLKSSTMHEWEKVLQFQGMAEGSQKIQESIVTGDTRDEEWPLTVANI